ncbi:MAG: glycosyltransferase [Phycisphaeraceae bacterium]|nr:glycosyltransferase [Phycisphaeraceae bacterium]
MRIVHVNWAKIWHGASRGGGINGYCQNLGLQLAARGHDVVSFTSGTAPPSPGVKRDPKGPCFVRRHPDWESIRVFEVVGSPVKAPSAQQFDDPEAEISSPMLEEVVSSFLDALRPDVVHFHSLEGWTAGCVRAAASSGAITIFSLHNWHPICPQVYLMQGKRLACTNYDNGHACVGCLKKFDTPTAAEGAVTPMRVERPEQVVGLLAGPEPDPRSVTLPVVEPSFDPADPRYWPVPNIPNHEPSSEREPTGYARRRAAMIEALNQCDRVLAVSSFVADKFEAMGVDRRRLITLPIGTRMVEIAERLRRATEPPPAFDVDPSRLIRLAFLGFHNAYKGLDMLADALELLPGETLGRFHLSIHAMGAESIEARFRRLEARLGRLTFTTGYAYHDIPWLIGGADMGIVPSIWWDNAPQTVFEFQACRVPVLGAEMGGIPDFVRNGFDGLLFRGNDRADLARKLESIVAHPQTLTRLRGNLRPPKSMTAHVREMESLYKACRVGRG